MNIDLPSYSTVETTKPKVQFETIEVTTTTQPESNDDKSGFRPFTLLGFFFRQWNNYCSSIVVLV